MRSTPHQSYSKGMTDEMAIHKFRIPHYTFILGFIMKHIRFIAFILTAALIAPFAASCGKKNEPRSATFYEYFDTVSTIYSYADEDEALFSEHQKLIEAELEVYHRLFDIYHEYSGMNNLRTVNLNAGASAVKVDGRLIDLLLYAKEIYALTNGEVNVAMGAVLSLWHGCREDAEDDPDHACLPAPESLREAAEHTDIDSIVIDREASTVYISDSKVTIDVGALGKGYAAEMIAKMLKEKGVSSYVLDIGGNLRLIGQKPDGSGWVTGITEPDKASAQAFATRVNISDTSCVTSGSYERYYTVGGKNYHHIIDKDTLYPSEYFLSVTVITPDSALADALSTALFSMPYKDGAALVESLDNVEALWITAEGERLSTEGFGAMEISPTLPNI